MENNRNFFITIALSVLILTLWQVFYMNSAHRAAARDRRASKQRARRGAEEGRRAGAVPAHRNARAAAGRRPGRAGHRRRDGGRAASRRLPRPQRVKIDTPSLSGSINLTGARLDDLRLKHYTDDGRQELARDRAAQPVGAADRLLSPRSASSATTRPATLPGADTVWTVDGNATLTPATPVTLDLHQRQGPDLQAHDLGRRRLHVHRLRHGAPIPARPPSSLSNYGRVTPLRQAAAPPAPTCCTKA